MGYDLKGNEDIILGQNRSTLPFLILFTMGMLFQGRVSGCTGCLTVHLESDIGFQPLGYRIREDNVIGFFPLK